MKNVIELYSDYFDPYKETYENLTEEKKRA